MARERWHKRHTTQDTRDVAYETWHQIPGIETGHRDLAKSNDTRETAAGNAARSGRCCLFGVVICSSTTPCLTPPPVDPTKQPSQTTWRATQPASACSAPPPKLPQCRSRTAPKSSKPPSTPSPAKYRSWSAAVQSIWTMWWFIWNRRESLERTRRWLLRRITSSRRRYVN